MSVVEQMRDFEAIFHDKHKSELARTTFSLVVTYMAWPDYVFIVQLIKFVSVTCLELVC